jgi:MoaA/NifB/PqqE/SkfB family radical SAM enzyme
VRERERREIGEEREERERERKERERERTREERERERRKIERERERYKRGREREDMDERYPKRNGESSESDETQHENYILFSQSDGRPLPSPNLHIIHMDWRAAGPPTLMLLLVCLTALPLVILYVSEHASAMAA